MTETERRILQLLGAGPLGLRGIVTAFGHRTVSGSLRKALDRLGSLGLVALTMPGKPNSRLQQRTLTAADRQVLTEL